MTERVTYRCEAGIAGIAMDGGKVNVMSAAMLRDLDAALDRAEADKAMVVLRSARDGIFSAGFDLKVFAANDPLRSLEMVKAGAELALRLLSFPHPTIGVMEGHAFRMGTLSSWRAMSASARSAKPGWGSTRWRSASRRPASRSSSREAGCIRPG